MDIVYVYADTPEEWNCSEWRCAIPARAINKTAGNRAQLVWIEDFSLNRPQARAACTTADLIVVQRNLFGRVLQAISYWQAQGKAVIADFDDAYDLLPETVGAHYFWRRALTPQPGPNGQITWRKLPFDPLVEFKRGLRLVHATTVPSKQLAADWQDVTDVHIVPNYLDLEKYIFVQRRPHEGIILGWGGSVSHLDSFTGSGIFRALARIVAVHKEVRVLICGSDTRIFDQLPLPPEHKIYQPFVPFARWPQVLASFDIGLAPLHGAYDQRRSWIKALEYMAMKIPWVGTQGAPYHDLAAYGWLVPNDPAAWEHALRTIIDHLEEYRARAALEPYLQGLMLSVDVNVDRILATYEDIILAAQRRPRHKRKPAAAHSADRVGQ